MRGSDAGHTGASDDDAAWWRSAAIYQVYVRSFGDGSGDGVGDLAGVRQRLPYLRDLGVDALWFTPWYPSPQADGGYDVADYRAIDPAFGDLAEAERLIREARDIGLRTIVDVVPNHVSDQHAWFQAALTAGSGSPERERFWFRPGRGPGGDEPPNDWVSEFAGVPWTRTKDDDGTPGDWYLHLFTPEQPDLNWTHPDVRREHEDVLRFWFDRGAAGVRIDSAVLVAKDPALPDVGPRRARSSDPAPATAGFPPGDHPYVDRDELHDIYASWRRVADAYDEPRVLVGEVWMPDAERLALYLRPTELHTAFNLDFLTCPWEARRLRRSIDTTLASHAGVGAPATWVISNHDVTRPVTRYGRDDTSFSFAAKRSGTPTDLTVGLRRARAAALLAMALPGSVYVYQGEELGLPEVEGIEAHLIQDPMHFRSGGIDPGRDGARVPLPWSGAAAPFGFSPPGTIAEPWLPQPAEWADLTVEAQLADPDSTLSLYRTALLIRRTEDDLGDGPFAWLDAAPGSDDAADVDVAVTGVLAFARGDRFACVVNLSAAPVALPPHDHVLLASTPQAVTDGRLAPDTAAWLRRPGAAETGTDDRTSGAAATPDPGTAATPGPGTAATSSGTHDTTSDTDDTRTTDTTSDVATGDPTPPRQQRERSTT